MQPNPDTGIEERLIRLLEENEVLRSALRQTECGTELVRQRYEFSLLMEVSRRIVSELDLGRVLDMVAVNARRLVDAELLIIPMLNEARDSYTYRAAEGVDAGAVLNSTFPVHVGMCGWVLQNERSLLFGQASPCWLDEKTQWEEGQPSALLVPLFGRAGIIGGISALGKQGGGSFTHHDLDMLGMFASHVSMAIENAKLFSALSEEIEHRKRAEHDIALSLKEKEVLLAEIHHRVKNNMAVISSFLQMQSMVVDEAYVRQMFRECQQRVNSMALVHEKLYRSRNLSDIDLRDYIVQLVRDLMDSYGRTGVAASMDIAESSVRLDILIPLGLILNEIVSNSLKHAYEGIPEPRLDIVLRTDGGRAALSISDNGAGFDSDEVRSRRKTLGLGIIEALAGQIKATIQRSTDNGVRYVLSFPLTKE